MPAMYGDERQRHLATADCLCICFSAAQLPTACTHEEAYCLAPMRKLPAVNFEAIFRA